MNDKHVDLYLVRHGQTDSNTLGLFHGATDVPLNEVGLRQARLVAQRLAAIENLGSIHSSPLQRAHRTAQYIAMNHNTVPKLEPGLAEINFGEAEGFTYEVLVERYEALMVRFRDPADTEVAFPGGETRGAFHRRTRDAIDAIVNQYRGKRVIVVAHGGVISSLVSQILGEDPTDWRKYSVANCSVTHIEFATNGPLLHVVNDVVHLESLNVDLTVKG